MKFNKDLEKTDNEIDFEYKNILSQIIKIQEIDNLLYFFDNFSDLKITIEKYINEITDIIIDYDRPSYCLLSDKCKL